MKKQDIKEEMTSLDAPEMPAENQAPFVNADAFQAVPVATPAEPPAFQMDSESVLTDDMSMNESLMDPLATLQDGKHNASPNSKLVLAPGVFRPLRNGTILGSNGATRIDNKSADKQLQAHSLLQQSYLSHRSLTGRVMGVRPAYSKADSSCPMHYFAIVPFGPYLVYISAENFTDVNMSELAEEAHKFDATRTISDAERIFLQGRIGSEIDFVVTRMPASEEEGPYAGGSRVDSMYRSRVYFWFGYTSANLPLINEGDRVKARIVAVFRTGIRIEIFGVETFIPNHDLSYSYLQDARKQYATGQELEVIITSIDRNQGNDYEVIFEASAKLANPDPRERALQMFTDNGLYHGVINYVRIPSYDTPNVRPAVFVLLAEGVQCLCPFPNGTIMPQVGAQVQVLITNHNTENNYLYGKIHQISPQTPVQMANPFGYGY